MYNRGATFKDSLLDLNISTEVIHVMTEGDMERSSSLALRETDRCPSRKSKLPVGRAAGNLDSLICIGQNGNIYAAFLHWKRKAVSRANSLKRPLKEKFSQALRVLYEPLRI